MGNRGRGVEKIYKRREVEEEKKRRREALAICPRRISYRTYFPSKLKWLETKRINEINEINGSVPCSYLQLSNLGVQMEGLVDSKIEVVG